jgi:hypothetical protein
MSNNSSDSNLSSPDFTEVDPNFIIDITNIDTKTTPVVTRSQAKANSKNTFDQINNLIDLDQSINSENNNIDMSELLLETAIKLIPHFNGQN